MGKKNKHLKVLANVISRVLVGFFYLNRSSVVAVVRAAQICGER